MLTSGTRRSRTSRRKRRRRREEEESEEQQEERLEEVGEERGSSYKFAPAPDPDRRSSPEISGNPRKSPEASWGLRRAEKGRKCPERVRGILSSIVEGRGQNLAGRRLSTAFGGSLTPNGAKIIALRTAQPGPESYPRPRWSHDGLARARR